MGTHNVYVDKLKKVQHLAKDYHSAVLLPGHPRDSSASLLEGVKNMDTRTLVPPTSAVQMGVQNDAQSPVQTKPSAAGSRVLPSPWEHRPCLNLE